ncbi:hypothetical protein C8D77_101228 [Mesorhizobium loti]|uniref:Uncharacterized protein n=1 Tax=Rhizobium loti TaxID=381 RepID=A0A8E2WIG7_RHILI|nr:hypothetical protein [Mesorhizobium loti]PWJ93549.1 hypothetical protein C8D77_101228 [Mesorhizobium loti]
MNEKSENEVRASAVAAMDKAFGIGVTEAHRAIRTEASARRIYDCAIAALAEERSKVVAHLRDQARINLQNAAHHGKGKGRDDLLEEFVRTGDRLALECYRKFYIAESLGATAYMIEDGAYGPEVAVDFDIEGARWMDLTSVGSPYEEQRDMSRDTGLWRHRSRAIDSHDPWREGRAPKTERPA